MSWFRKRTQAPIDRWLAHLAPHLSPLDARARRPALRSLTERLMGQSGPELPSNAALVVRLVTEADVAHHAALQLETTAAQLSLAYQTALTERAQREVLAEHLRETRSGRDLVRDLRALDRDLDLEALQERLAVAIADRLDEVEVAYAVAAGVAESIEAGPDRLLALGGGRVPSLAFTHAAVGQREIVRRVALRFLVRLLALLPPRERWQSLGRERYRTVLAWAADGDTPRWVRVAAVELCMDVALNQALPTLTAILGEREQADGMVVRRNVLKRLAGAPLDVKQVLSLAAPCTDDPSEYVRQELALLLATLPGAEAFTRGAYLLCDDPSPCVRGAAARALVLRAARWSDDVVLIRQAFERYLSEAKSRVDVAAGLEAVERLCVGAGAPCEPQAFVSALTELIGREGTEHVQAEEAAALLRRLEVEAAPALQTAAERLKAVLAELPEGKQRVVQLPERLRLRDVEFALATAARGDLTVGLRALGGGRYRLRRGERQGYRSWRLLHEVRSPAPDKRKAHPHARGRRAGPGSLVPSHLMAEVTPTRVPGERRLARALGSWGPFLPRIDDLLEACRPLARPVRIVTSLGVVTVEGPPLGWARALAWLRLTLRYADYDALRQRSLGSDDPQVQRRFAETCRKLGFRIRLAEADGHIGGVRYQALAPRVLQYFAGGAFLPDLRHHLQGLLQYTLTPTGNLPWHLSALVWTVLAGFIGRAAWIMGRIESARRAIPISIGGWGTRGKSGTERLKAALFHGLRYDVVVKTTGCEAMFIHARRDLPAREIFLYRPYDKATIWEQRRVLEFGANLGAQVFLWECMALNPQFVQVLNRDWMQDPVTTLTNAYPDHEDVMGPSGEDVARVIGLFMPSGGTTYTAEEQMLPILRDMARKQGTRLSAVGGLEADLLPKDLLDRFPYDEHPRNIALVLALAEHYGVDREFALIEMADRVVPDLGVLKTYPCVRYRGRDLQFSNGMSANERAGFLSNWTRLGFDTMDYDAEPTTLSVAVVNNRADRVPRSRVFAEILARDTAVSTIVLIGTNLEGMHSFLEEACAAEVDQLAFEPGETPQAGETRLLDWLRRLALPTTPAGFAAQLQATFGVALGEEGLQRLREHPEYAAASQEYAEEALSRLLEAFPPTEDSPITADELAHHARAIGGRARALQALRSQVTEALQRGAHAEATQLARQQWLKLAMARVHILEAADAKGDQVVDFVTSCIAPGHFARLLGCQNIKGTGLDFVYRFTALLEMETFLGRIEREPTSRGELLAQLMTRTDYGILDTQSALDKLAEWRASSDADWQAHHELLQRAEAHFRELYRKKREGLTRVASKNPWERLLDRAVEPLLDHWDSTRRTRGANRIMQDLFFVRVGQATAALKLRDLVARQKGGWLSRALRRTRG